MEPLGDLSRCSGTFDVLLFLLQKGKTTALRIMKESNMKRGTFYSAIALLERYQLVFKVEEKGFPTRASYDLTLTGENLAKHLIPLKDILSDTIEALRKELLDLDQQRRTKKNLGRTLELSGTLMGLSFKSGEWEESLEFSQRILELSEKLDSPADMERAYRNIGLIHQGRNHYEQALESFNKSLKIASQLKDPIKLSENEYSIGAIFERWGRFDEAARHYDDCMRFAIKAKDDPMQAKGHLGKGRVLAQKEKHRESYKEMSKAVQLLEKQNEIEELPKAYANMGATAFYLDRKDALKWHEKSIEVARRVGNIRILGYGLCNAASCYINERRWKKTMEYLEEAFDILQKLDDERMISSVYLYYGSMYNLRKEWRLSEENFHKSLRIAEKLNVPSQLADVLFHFALMFKNKRDSKRASSYFDRALRIFEKLQNKEKIKEIERETEGINR